MEPVEPDESTFTVDDWIARLEDPAEARRAAGKLVEISYQADAHKAIEPTLAAWRKHGQDPELFKSALRLTAESAGGPYWSRVLPTLRTAVRECNVSDSRSLDSAIHAVEALAAQRDADILPVLSDLATQSTADLVPGHRLRMASIAALGRYGDRPDVVDPLSRLLRVEPSHRVQMVPAAAALALAETRSSSAVIPLLQALIRIPAIYPACRRALIAIGRPAVPALIAMAQGKQPELDQLARDLELNVACDQAMGLGTTCPAPTLLQYRAATLLRDFYITSTVTPLLRELEKPARPSFFGRSRTGPDQHAAILQTLGHLGEPSAAAPIWQYVQQSGHKPANRAAAIAAYASLESDPAALETLARLLADPATADALRDASASGYARMVRDPAAMAPIVALVADRPAPAADGKLGPHGLVISAHVGATCKSDPACYTTFLGDELTPVLAELETAVIDFRSWPKPAVNAAVQVVRERALLELAKLGATASEQRDVLLERIAFTDVKLRRAALRALVRVAKRPCESCVARLDQLIIEDGQHAERTALVVETQIVRRYFAGVAR